MTFGAAVRALRKQKGLTILQFGKAVGTSESYMNAIERKEQNISRRMARRIADALGLPLSALELLAETLEAEDKSNT